jgi:hypothetical protein
MPRKSSQSPKESTKGREVEVNFGGVSAVFTAGGSKRVLVTKEYDSASYGPVGFVYVNGLIRLADGTEVWAILGIDEASSGEHGDTGVWLPDGGFAWLDEKTPKALGKTKAQVFPYQYKCDAAVHCSDHHVGPDGWSRKW